MSAHKSNPEPDNSLVYHRLYAEPPPRSELAMSQLTDEGGLPRLIPPPPLESPIKPRHRRPPICLIDQIGRAPPVERKKTRIVCISDTHNTSPLNGQFKIPPGDVLVHAGDMTNMGSYKELKRALDWIAGLEHEVKIIIAGNHDGVTLDPEFHREYGAYFHNTNPQSHEQNLVLFTSAEVRAKGVVYLNHEARVITLKDGRRFKVFGSPWSKKQGLWGFGYGEPQSLEESLWKDIPQDTDILITHTPPYTHLDTRSTSVLSPSSSLGCKYLRQALCNIRPRLHIFGHIHESHGVEIVKWSARKGFLQSRALSVQSIPDPFPESPKKQFVVKLPDGGGQEDINTESCLVNAAIVNTSYCNRDQQKSRGVVRYNKPIVVELELEVVPVEPLFTVRGVEEGWNLVLLKDAVTAPAPLGEEEGE